MLKCSFLHSGFLVLFGSLLKDILSKHCVCFFFFFLKAVHIDVYLLLHFLIQVICFNMPSKHNMWSFLIYFTGGPIQEMFYLFRIPTATLYYLIPETCQAIYDALKEIYLKVICYMSLHDIMFIHYLLSITIMMTMMTFIVIITCTKNCGWSLTYNK